MADLILALDQGTTGTTVMVIDARGNILGRAYGEIRQFYPRPGWVEHDPEQIYRSAVALGRAAIAASRVQARRHRSIGNHQPARNVRGMGTASGRPVHRAIVWQCRRSAGFARPRQARGRGTRAHGVADRSLLFRHQAQMAARREPELRRRAARGELCFGTIDSWLIFRLSRGAAFVTDFTNASRTMMLNLKQRTWDAAMLRMLGVPAAMLPER